MHVDTTITINFRHTVLRIQKLADTDRAWQYRLKPLGAQRGATQPTFEGKKKNMHDFFKERS